MRYIEYATYTCHDPALGDETRRAIQVPAGTRYDERRAAAKEWAMVHFAEAKPDRRLNVYDVTVVDIRGSKETLRVEIVPATAWEAVVVEDDPKESLKPRLRKKA